MQFIMGASRSWKMKLTVATLFLLLGTVLIFTVQFNRVPRERVSSYLNINGYPTQECDAELFPARHWTRQSKYSPVAKASTHHSEQMYGTVAAQNAIWSHQHPRTCHDKKFLVYEALGQDHGIGSVVHVISVALQAALNLDRILVLYPQPNFEWVQGKYCEGMENLDECYFEPLSSCTIMDAFGGMEVTNDNLGKFLELNVKTYASNSERVLRSAVWSMGSGVLPSLPQETPLMFRSLLKRGGVASNFFYWWRAQSTAYVVRPTLRTLRELDRRRGVIFAGRPIQPGTISVHIRHGDKWKEAKLEDDATFLRSAETLFEQYPDGLQRRVFLSTEDPVTVRFFAGLGNWTVEYTDVKRLGNDPNLSPEKFAASIGWDEEFLNSLLSLQLAVECDGFVGAIASNWNRLIDELRSTVRCKHDRVYVDVVQGFHVTDYIW